MKSLINYFTTALMLLVLFTACESQWEEHTKTRELRGKSLMDVISENPETSVFASILQKTGYDELLGGDKMITVFAPVNAVLAGVDMNNVEALKSIVRNHLAYAGYPVSQGKFASEKVEMINGKNLRIEGVSINGVALLTETGKYNLTAANGILHLINGMIPVQKNIWEYLQSETNHIQVDFIKKQDKLVMDMEKSVQIGVTPSGKPLYDTIWRNENRMLKAHPINAENQNFTFILLPNPVIERIETKYQTYFMKDDAVLQDSIVRAELISDCVLLPVKITADGKYASLEGVKMDISNSNILEVYQASNGTVYRMNDADVKIYENKVKTIQVEGEDYFSFYADNMNAWMMRQRPLLHGGKDMVLNSPTTFITSYRYSDSDTTMNISINRTFSPRDATYNAGRVNNCYIEFKPVIHSVPYKIYWAAYNDYSAHINLPITLSINTGTRTVRVDTAITAQFSQKMLISFPDKPVVKRNSSGDVVNNFSLLHVFTSNRFKAGLPEEKQLFKSIINTDATLLPYIMPTKKATFTGEDDFFVKFEGEDQYGDKETIINPTYGQATILVANTSENRATNSGMIFLDYFKLVPVIDPNE